MKNNFFKKLAFVLALALVVTSIAPVAATTASAAKAPALTIKTKTLYVGGATHNINVKNKPSAKSTYAWTSSNKKVATVNAKNGVVKAVAPGKATIKCVIKNAKTAKTTKTLTAVVTIKQDATAVTVNNKEIVDNKITIGVDEKSFDFNRTLTPKTSTNKTYWVIDEATNTAGATVDSQGFVSTTKVGEFTIQAVTARSRANFDAGKFTQESEVITVKVPVAITEVKQTTANTIELKFNDNVKDVVKAADLVIKNATNHMVQAIKGITFSEDGKTVTVESWVNYADATAYKLTFAEKDYDFTASVGKVSSVVIKTTEVVFSVPEKIDYALYDANGIDVTKTVEDYKVDVDIDTTAGYKDGEGKLVLFAKGDTAKVKVTYHTYTYENGAEVTVFAEGVITAVDKKTVTVGNYEKYTIAKTAPDWAKVTEGNNKISANESGYSIFVKAKNSKNEDVTDITYTSSNDSVLLVTERGLLLPVKEGSVYVIAKAGDTTWTLLVNVVGERKATAIAIKDNKTAVTISNSTKAKQTIDIEVVLKDQFGADFDVTKVDVTDLNKNTPGKAPSVVAAGSKVTINAWSPEATKGTYTFLLESAERKITIAVNVVEPSGTDVVYKLDLSASEIDTVIKTDTVITSKDLKITIGDYRGGVLDDHTAITVSNVAITGPDGKPATVATLADGSIGFETVVSGASIVKAATGTYKVVVTLKDKNNKDFPLTQYFKVVDTQVAPTLALDKLITDYTTVLSAANDCFTIKDADAKELTITDVDYDRAGKAKDETINSPLSGKQIYVKSVTVKTVIGSFTLDQKVAVGKTITIK